MLAAAVSVLAVSMAVLGTGFGVTALATTAFGFAASVVLWTIGETGYAAVINAVFAGLAPARLHGRYMGAAGFAWALAGVTGPIAGTSVLQRAGANQLWTGCAVLGTLLCLAQLAVAPRIRTRIKGTSEPESAEEVASRPTVSALASA